MWGSKYLCYEMLIVFDARILMTDARSDCRHTATAIRDSPKLLSESGRLVLKLDRTAWLGFVGAEAAFLSVASKASLADPAIPSIFSPSSTPADSIYLRLIANVSAILSPVFGERVGFELVSPALHSTRTT